MRVRKTDETKLAEVTGRLRDLHMNTMAEELIRESELKAASDARSGASLQTD